MQEVKQLDIIIKGIEAPLVNVIPETESSTNNFGIYKAKLK